MKKPIIFALLAACLALSACDEDPKYGGWDPIKVDKPTLEFTAEGGTQTATATNYSGWWINGGYENHPDVDYVYSTSSGGEEAHTFDVLNGEWYHAKVPLRGNKLVVTVDANTTGKQRTLYIDMEAGDAFTTVKVTQQ